MPGGGSAAAINMSLRDGSKKMSKSDPSDASRITLTDDADAIAKKIRKATTDSDVLPGPDILDATGQVPEELRQSRPEAFNLIEIFTALSGQDFKTALTDFEGKGFADLKRQLVEVAVEVMGPIGSEMTRMMNDPSEVDAVLRDGAARANALADPILEEVYDIVGFLRP